METEALVADPNGIGALVVWTTAGVCLDIQYRPVYLHIVLTTYI
jgi:hypothetical protein